MEHGDRVPRGGRAGSLDGAPSPPRSPSTHSTDHSLPNTPGGSGLSGQRVVVRSLVSTGSDFCHHSSAV